MNKSMEQLIRDLCSVEFRSKSKTKRLIEDYTKKVREETIREVEENLPKTEKSHTYSSENTDIYIAYCDGYNKCLKEVLEKLNKLKK